MVFIWLAKLLYNTDKVNAEYAMPDSYTRPTERTKTLLRELVVIAIPITLSSSVMSLANLIDLAVVSRRLQDSGLSEAAAAALYGNYTTLAVPLFNLPPVLVYPIGYSLVPMLSSLLVQKDEARLQRVMNSSLKVAAILSIPCAVGMAALAEPILLMIFGNKNGSAETAAPLLASSPEYAALGFAPSRMMRMLSASASSAVLCKSMSSVRRMSLPAIGSLTMVSEIRLPYLSSTISRVPSTPRRMSSYAASAPEMPT